MRCMLKSQMADDVVPRLLSRHEVGRHCDPVGLSRSMQVAQRWNLNKANIRTWHTRFSRGIVLEIRLHLSQIIWTELPVYPCAVPYMNNGSSVIVSCKTPIDMAQWYKRIRQYLQIWIWSMSVVCRSYHKRNRCVPSPFLNIYQSHVSQMWQSEHRSKYFIVL